MGLNKRGQKGKRRLLPTSKAFESWSFLKCYKRPYGELFNNVLLVVCYYYRHAVTMNMHGFLFYSQTDHTKLKTPWHMHETLISAELFSSSKHLCTLSTTVISGYAHWRQVFLHLVPVECYMCLDGLLLKTTFFLWICLYCYQPECVVVPCCGYGVMGPSGVPRRRPTPHPLPSHSSSKQTLTRRRWTPPVTPCPKKR